MTLILGNYDYLNDHGAIHDYLKKNDGHLSRLIYVRIHVSTFVDMSTYVTYPCVNFYECYYCLIYPQLTNTM
jgi:hypothetical protein